MGSELSKDNPAPPRRVGIEMMNDFLPAPYGPQSPYAAFFDGGDSTTHRNNGTLHPPITCSDTEMDSKKRGFDGAVTHSSNGAMLRTTVISSATDSISHFFSHSPELPTEAFIKVGNQSFKQVQSLAINPPKLMYAGPYLSQDHSFKPYSFYKDLPAGTTIYHSMETICSVQRGGHFGRKGGVYRSTCGRYVMKKRSCTEHLNRWKHLPNNDHIVPLLGVMTAGPDGFYEITEHMSGGDLRQVTGRVTLKQLADRQTIRQWTKTWKNFSHIVRSVLNGIIHLNNHGLQHYDLKEDNIIVGKPYGCTCESILTCTCQEQWIIKIGDFDTLYTLERPESWHCGTKYYRPPESEAHCPRYSVPVYDSWSIGVIIVHLCAGTAIREFDKRALKMRQLKYLECYYAKDHFLRNLVFGTNQRRLNPVVELARSCLQVDINMRPTPAELLEKWDKLCEGGEVSATLF